MVRVCDAETGQEILTFKGNTIAVTCVCFSLYGTRLASTSSGGVRLWEATKSGEDGAP